MTDEVELTERREQERAETAWLQREWDEKGMP